MPDPLPVSNQRKNRNSPQAQLPFRIFISYTSEDGALASEIHQSLVNTFSTNDLGVDLMKEFRPGTEWRKEIDDCLSKADLLLLVYTGQLKPSHGWTGYEVGFFSSEINRIPERFPNVPREIVPINFLRSREATTETIEGIEFSEKEVTRPDITIPHLAENPDKFIASVGGASDQLFALFQKIADSLETCSNRPTQNKEREQRDKVLLQGVIVLYKRLHSLLRQRQKDDIGLQSKIVVSISSEDSTLLASDDRNSLIEFQNQAEDVFHISDAFVSNQDSRRMNWATFEEVVVKRNDGQLAELWLANLRELVKSAHTSQFIDNDLLLPSWDQLKTYRAVVTRRVRFYSGRVDIHVYLFELFKREDYGDRKTTTYLNAVAMGCRYRSLFLEPNSLFAPQWMKPLSGNKLRNQVIKMIRELDLVHQEAIRCKLNANEAIAEVYGTDGAEFLARAFADWFRTEKALRIQAAAVVRCKDDNALSEVRKEFDLSLVDFCKTTDVVNVDYLNRALKKLEARHSELIKTLAGVSKEAENKPN